MNALSRVNTRLDERGDKVFKVFGTWCKRASQVGDIRVIDLKASWESPASERTISVKIPVDQPVFMSGKYTGVSSRRFRIW